MQENGIITANPTFIHSPLFFMTIMSKPISVPKSPRLLLDSPSIHYLTLILFLVSLFFFTLQVKGTPASILQYTFAWDKSNADTIKVIWDLKGLFETLWIAFAFDFLLVLAYWRSAYEASKSLNPKSKGNDTKRLLLFATLAAVCDILKVILCIVTVYHNATDFLMHFIFGLTVIRSIALFLSVHSIYLHLAKSSEYEHFIFVVKHCLPIISLIILFLLVISLPQMQDVISSLLIDAESISLALATISYIAFTSGMTFGCLILLNDDPRQSPLSAENKTIVASTILAAITFGTMWQLLRTSHGLPESLTIRVYVANGVILIIGGVLQWILSRIPRRLLDSYRSPMDGEENGKWDLLRVITTLLLYSPLILNLLISLFTWGNTSALVTLASALGPLPIVLFGIGFLGNLIVIFHRIQCKSRIPIIPGLIICAITIPWIGWSDNHALPGGAQPSSIAHKHLKGAPTLRTDFEKWLQSRREAIKEYNTRGLPYPVFFVAAPGGGIYAAYQAGMSLAVIQEENPHFMDHLYLISSVSGGSLGSAAFVAQVSRSKVAAQEQFAADMDRFLAHDLLSPPLASLLSPDSLQRFNFAFPHTADRAAALEGAVERAWKDETGGNEFGESMYLMYQRDGNYRLPLLFINVTNVESGRRYVVSYAHPNVRSKSTKSWPVRGNLKEDSWGTNGLRSLGDVAPYLDMKLSTSVVLSARFPLITPSGFVVVPKSANIVSNEGITDLDTDHTIDYSTKMRFVDGGYSDNSGLETLMELLSGLIRSQAQKPDAGVWEPVILFINYRGDPQMELEGLPSAEPGFSWASPLNASPEDISPLSTTVNVYSAARGEATYQRLKTYAPMGWSARPGYGRKRYRSDEFVRIERKVLNKRLEVRFRQGKTPLPLGWSLSERARSSLLNQLDCYRELNQKNSVRDRNGDKWVYQISGRFKNLRIDPHSQEYRSETSAYRDRSLDKVIKFNQLNLDSIRLILQLDKEPVRVRESAVLRLRHQYPSRDTHLGGRR